jgi:hypothetical protein
MRGMKKRVAPQDGADFVRQKSTQNPQTQKGRLTPSRWTLVDRRGMPSLWVCAHHQRRDEEKEEQLRARAHTRGSLVGFRDRFSKLFEQKKNLPPKKWIVHDTGVHFFLNSKSLLDWKGCSRNFT